MLQHVILPEPDSAQPVEMFVRLTGGAYLEVAVAPDEAPGAVVLPPGGRAGFDTYFNALSIGKWHGECRLDGLWLELSGTGTVTVTLWHAAGPEAAPALLCAAKLGLAGGAAIDLAPTLPERPEGLIWCELQAHDAARLEAARWCSHRPADAVPVRLAICVTTFRREAAVAHTAQRLSDWLGHTGLGARAHVFVIDNGGTAELPALDHVTRLDNPNLGGAGGFARGLLEAEAGGFTHALFMDDDALFPLENIHRTHAFLSLARDPATALAGAMITHSAPARMWENSAVFDGKCRPRFKGLDLCDRAAVLELECGSRPPGPANLYGGWWFFAFPLAAARYAPFPFFVRGDDVSFALANDFRIITLNGVVSLQEDFFEKESPLNWYLDLRSHMVHHLALEHMERGAARVAWIGISFCLRNILRCQYQTARAVLLAWEDVLRGPALFEDHLDMARKRAEIAALTPDEIWQPLPADAPRTPRVLIPHSALRRRFFLYTLNGHLLPFFGLLGDRAVVPLENRGDPLAVWGASRITYLGPDGQGYRLCHSKQRFVAVMGRMALTAARFLWCYRSLCASYRARYPQMASRTFWKRRLRSSMAEDRRRGVCD